MKAAVLEELGKIVVREVPDPADRRRFGPAPGGVGRRLRFRHPHFRHGNPRVKPPAIIGHEIAGTVVEAGKNVTRVKVGDRVAVGADVPCGQCPWCRDGLGNNCAVNYAIGYQIPGGFAQYMKLPPPGAGRRPGHAVRRVARFRHGRPGRAAGLRDQRPGTGRPVAGQDGGDHRHGTDRLHDDRPGAGDGRDEGDLRAAEQAPHGDRPPLRGRRLYRLGRGGRGGPLPRGDRRRGARRGHHHLRLGRGPRAGHRDGGPSRLREPVRRVGKERAADVACCRTRFTTRNVSSQARTAACRGTTNWP